MTEIESLIEQINKALPLIVERHRASLVPLPKEYIRQVYDRCHPRAKNAI